MKINHFVTILICTTTCLTSYIAWHFNMFETNFTGVQASNPTLYTLWVLITSITLLFILYQHAKSQQLLYFITCFLLIVAALSPYDSKFPFFSFIHVFFAYVGFCCYNIVFFSSYQQQFPLLIVSTGLIILYTQFNSINGFMEILYLLTIFVLHIKKSRY